MSLPESDNKPKITLDELLKLKRLEQPASHFWENFSREIKTKKLQLLLEKSRPSLWSTAIRPLLVSGPAMAAIFAVGLFLKTGTQSFFASYEGGRSTAQVAAIQSGSSNPGEASWTSRNALQSAYYVWDRMVESEDLLMSDALSFTPQDDYAMHILDAQLVAQCQSSHGAI